MTSEKQHTCSNCKQPSKNTFLLSEKVEENKVYTCDACNNKYLYAQPNPRHNVFNDVEGNSWVEIKLK